MIQNSRSYGIQILHSNWIYLILMIAVFIAVVLTLMVISWTRQGTAVFEWPEVILRLGKWWKPLAGFVMIVLPFLFSAAILHPYVGKYYIAGFYTRLALFWCLALAGMFCVRIIRKDLPWLYTLGISVLIMAVVYRAAVSFSMVTDYPFARGWSEISRIYGGSLFFAQRLYGEKVALSVLHPAWHLLLTVPYIFGNLPIWVQRLWQVLLQVGLTGLLVLGIMKRLKPGSQFQVGLLTSWGFLFLMQGPILIHLLVCAMIVIFAVKPERFWRTTIIVLVASIWAGWTRINWFPVPALLTAAIYFLEIPMAEAKRWFAYFWKPAFWFVIGTLLALASNMFYMAWSGNGGGGNFASSMTSDLFWYRLLPNPTYPHGVLPDLLLVSIPLILVIVFALRQARGAFHPIRLAAILGITLVLFMGGVVVSTKIGGGSDLHNMDAYLILLMLVAGYLLYGAFKPQQGKTEPLVANQRPILLSLLVLGIAVPVGFALQYGRPVFLWDHLQTEQEVSTLKSRVEEVSHQGGKVLFISQRQFLALKIVDVPLVPDYEQDFLMEMVMSHNRPYLAQFQADLKAKKFAMIVADAQNIHYYGRTSSFGEENDLWVNAVSIPMLCYYSPTYPLGESGVVLFTPREKPCDNK